MALLNLKYRQIKAFVLAVESKSFRAAANKLCVTQPSFSVLIKELEADLGLTLFERDGRGLRTSDAGNKFYTSVVKPLAALEHVYAQAKLRANTPAPTLTIATLPSLSGGMMGDMVVAFAQSQPGVEVTLLELKHNQIPGAVARYEVDFGIGSPMDLLDGLRFTHLFEDQLVVIAPLEHPILKQEPTWASIEGLNFVLMTGGPTERGMVASGARPAHVLRIEQAPTALSMVRKGLGVTVLPATILPSCNLQDLVTLPMQGNHASRQIGLIVRESEPLRPEAQAFIDLMSEFQERWQADPAHSWWMRDSWRLE